MRRITLMITVAAMMAMTLVMTASPVMADTDFDHGGISIDGIGGGGFISVGSNDHDDFGFDFGDDEGVQFVVSQDSHSGDIDFD